MNFTEIDPTDLNSPCRELSNGGLGIVVALLVFWQIIFCVCVYCGSNPAVSIVHIKNMLSETTKVSSS